MRGGQNLDDLDQDAIEIAAQRTFDRSKVWDSPDPTIDLKSLHLKENYYPLEGLSDQES